MFTECEVVKKRNTNIDDDCLKGLENISKHNKNKVLYENNKKNRFR